MAKLQVSVSRMTSRRAAAMSIARSSSASDCRRCNFESGGESVVADANERPVRGREDGIRLAIGSIQVVRNDETDLLR